MRGYTAKKGDRYYAVIYEGVDPVTGKERRRWYAAGPRKADAQQLVTELMKRKNDGEYRPPDRVTLGSYLTDRWLPTKRAQLRLSTFDSYGRNIKLHVIPRIGQIPLQRLTPEDLDTLYATLAEERANGRRGLAPKTIHSIHQMLHKALADAERKGSVVRNVAALADPPKLSSAKKRTMRVWDAEQLRQFLDGIEEHRFHPAYYLVGQHGDASRRSPRAPMAGCRLGRPAAVGEPGDHLRCVRRPDRRRQDRFGPPDDRPRPSNSRRPPVLAEAPTRGTAGAGRKLRRPRARVRPSRGRPDPPRPVQQDLRPDGCSVPPTGDSAARPSTWSCESPAEIWRSGESRKRAARTRHARLHDDGLPACPARHAGRSGTTFANLVFGPE